MGCQAELVEADEALRLVAAEPRRTGIFTDFDGTLSEIVDRPVDARPVLGAEGILDELARRFAVVGVVSGRSLEDLRARLAPEGVVLAGSYGRERSDRPGAGPSAGDWEPVVAAASLIAQRLPGVVLERKGQGIALHYRAAPSHEDEVRRSAATLAEELGLEVLQGRLVAELVRPGPNKGDAVAAIASEHDLATVLVAGDDVADLEAFEWARASALRSVLVAVASEEAPRELEAMADLAMAGPAELLGFLRKLAASVA
jgi:trehalose 6-phosphate phosphatase